MIPAAFDYVRARDLAQALDLLGSDAEAKLLAGGHSLIPLMKLRLATPARLIDIGRLAELRYLRDEGEVLAIGALTRIATIETDPVVRARAGLLGLAAAHVGDPQVRHRGTIGGSVAHGDPASDLPTALLALDARYVLTGRDGRRTVTAADFHTGFLSTALAPDEVLTEIRVPAGPRRFSYRTFANRSIDWALVAVAAVDGPGGLRVALANMAATPIRAIGVETASSDGATAAEAARFAADGTNPPEDTAASQGFRRHLARVLVGKALSELDGQAAQEGTAR